MSIMALAGLKNVVWNEKISKSFTEVKMLQFPSLFFLYISKQHMQWKWLQPYLSVECCENRGVHMYVP